MLHRSTSSRRRRASRSSASSPQSRGVPRSGSTPPTGRRASIAVSTSCDAPSITTSSPPDRSPRNSLVPDINRSPRLSLVPSESALSPRNNLAPDFDRSPRNSLVPYTNRSPRHSLTPDTYNRSPRNSLVPDPSALSPRNSLTPDCTFNRSPRNSIAPETLNRSSRNSLVPDTNRSPRHSLVPGDLYSSRNSLAPDFNRSPRNSLVPDQNVSRSPRHSIIPIDNEFSAPIIQNKSPRHSITPEMNRSPRGSIGPGDMPPSSTRTSPRGSIGEPVTKENISPRGSIAPEMGISGINRSPRGSIVAGRNGFGDYGDRSPRGSLTLTFQEPADSRSRRASADNQTGGRNRSTSPYRMSLRGPQVNLGYASSSAYSDGGSRRASSSVSQVSGDDQRRLCSENTKLGGGGLGGGGSSNNDIETGISLGLGISLTTYGSVTYQLKDANMESSGTCDFVCRALRIVNKTVVVTVVLVCLSTLPLLMLIMGIQFLRDCPREPHIPVYMVVGGSVGCIKMAWLLYTQLSTRHLDDTSSQASSAGSKVASIALTVFLIAWFILGNYWILHIKWPEYTPALFDPNRWCHRTLYVFSLIHLYILYAVFGVILLLIVTLATCQIVGCPWLGPGRYK